MATFLEASKLLEGENGDILILTDGQVWARKTSCPMRERVARDYIVLGCASASSRVGSASQDRFLALLARETGGISRFVTARERVDLSAVDLFASIGRPIASNLKGGAAIEPDPPPFVFSGTPVLVFGEADDLDQIDLTWDGGRMTLPVVFIENDIGEALRLLRGSRLITDWESRYPATEALATLEKREEGRISARLR